MTNIGFFLGVWLGGVVASLVEPGLCQLGDKLIQNTLSGLISGGLTGLAQGLVLSRHGFNGLCWTVATSLGWAVGIFIAGYFNMSDAVSPLMFGSMPPIIAYLTVLLPLTIAFAEMPLYMGYILSRLGMRLRSRAAALLIAGFCLALQYCALPLIIDLRFIIWPNRGNEPAKNSCQPRGIVWIDAFFVACLIEPLRPLVPE